MTERIGAYMLLVGFFALDFFIREAKSTGSADLSREENKSTLLIVLTLIFILFLSIGLNFFRVGLFKNILVARVALALMVLGLVIRTASMVTLRKYYTRTLTIVDEQQVVKSGIYRLIRHPGYLGTLLVWAAAGLAMSNILVFVIGLILLLIAYTYRIRNEEQMLMAKFGETYKTYMKSSWRLLPYVW